MSKFIVAALLVVGLCSVASACPQAIVAQGQCYAQPLVAQVVAQPVYAQVVLPQVGYVQQQVVNPYVQQQVILKQRQHVQRQVIRRPVVQKQRIVTRTVIR